ncbi:MAG: hypothetical protein HY815_26430, partial [Candidatus Riflebacteria bacterium]|nr:hypothetical protein [Candidatus Riflebacteria bacterium]
IELAAKSKGRTKKNGIDIFNLCMTEAALTLPKDPGAFKSVSSPSVAGAGHSTIMVNDVRKITFKLIPRGSGPLQLPTTDRTLIEVEIFCVDPSQGNAVRTRKITAENNVGVKGS